MSHTIWLIFLIFFSFSMTAPHLDEHQTRLHKLEQLQAAGINGFVTKFSKTHSVAELKALQGNYVLPDAELLMSEGSANSYSIAGRLMLFRTMGKISFGQLRDSSGDIQISFVKDLCSLDTGTECVQSIDISDSNISAYKFVEKFLDVGDFIGVKGELFVTKHGELTLFVNEFQLLTKSLKPLGDKWHGIEDIETRLRKRYLDTTMNTDTKAMLVRRSNFWQSMRSFLLQEGFLEVETPILEVTTGGADANPFATHHNALDIDVFLRISCGELWQKRLLVGGFEKTFEIGRIFRNEGMSPEHAQDYTQMENYRAFADYRDMMTLIRNMYLHIIDTVYGKKVFEIRGYTVDFNNTREEIDYTSIILEKTGIDIWQASEQQIEEKLAELKVSYEPCNRIRLIDTLWKFCRRQMSGPAFLMNVPKFMSPLAKSNPEAPHLTERFQIIIAGSEVGNGFSELNDPLDQQARFVEQQAMRDAGDDEAQMADREYVEALEHGMPPAAGFGVSERLFCFLENLPIREAQYFPLMRPENSEEGTTQTETGKSKETKIAVALLNVGIGLELWQELNTVAHLNAALGGRVGNKLFMQDTITTQDNTTIMLNIQHAIMIKEVETSNTIREVIALAKEKGLEVAEFTKEMLETSDDKKVIEQTKSKSYQEIEFLGVLLFGNKKEVESITKEFSLYTGKNSLTVGKELDSARSTSNEIQEPSDLPQAEQALQLIETYLTDTKRHCLQVGEIMRAFAQQLGQDEHYRWLAGALHDIDRDHIAKDADKHLKDEFDHIMATIDAPELLKNDIKSHGDRLTGVPVDSLIRKYLSAIDELSGFLYAYSLMRPTGFDGMEAKGAMKRIKDKTFAAGVDREHLRNCEKYLNISLNEFIDKMITIMKQL